jgi:two-component system OmpR family sensor kinase
MGTRRPTFGRLPIRLRLTVAFAGVLAAVLAVGGVALYALFEGDFDQQIDRDLDTRLADVTRLVDVAVRTREPSEPSRVPEASGEGIVQVYRSNGEVLASGPRVRGSRLLTRAQVERALRGRIHIARADTAAGQARLAAKPAQGASLVVAVGEGLERRDRALDRLRGLLFIAGPLALLLATYAGYQVAGAALRPVERMRVRAEQVTERDTSERLPVPDTNDEIEALGNTLNELLARLDAALARERRLLSDASHELRTPLTVLRTEVQLALRGERDATELRAALESASQETERLSRLADDLLVLARADQGRLPVRGEPLDAGELLGTAASRAAPSAGGRRLLAETDGAAGLVVSADPDRAAQALDNLVANALAHGAGDIRLSARRADGRVELHVADEGPGFTGELLEHAFERFRQGDPARSGEGTGLGLAIVAAIAAAHGGEAGARNLAGGGADVWIALPAA